MVTSNIHFNVLQPSPLDAVELCRAVEDKFLDLMTAWLRIKGDYLVVPRSLDADMLRWREMRVRHRGGDLRHTEAELLSTQAIAQWTVTQNCKLRNQPDKKIEWKNDG